MIIGVGKWTKRAYVVTMLSIVALACAGVHMTQGGSGVFAKTTARTLGYVIAENYPEIAMVGREVAKQYLAQKEESTFKRLILFFTSQVEDPLLEASIRDLVDLFEFEGEIITLEQYELLELIATAFIEGVTIGGVK